jgi:hypothetical protein
MLVNTNQLIEEALDWAVAKCEARTLETVLTNHSYWVGERDPAVRPKFEGEFMVTDPDDIDGFAIVGDDLDALVVEAHDMLFDVINYSTDWAQGGPIIDRERISVKDMHDGWKLTCIYNLNNGMEHVHLADDYLLAAMRTFVASKLGAEVEIPDELIDTQQPVERERG